MYFALHCITLLPRVSQLITTPHYIQSRDTIHSPRTPHVFIHPKILGKTNIHSSKLKYKCITLQSVLEAGTVASPSFYFIFRTRTKSSISSVNLHLSIWICSASMIRSACCGKPTNAQHILQILFTAHCTLFTVHYALYTIQCVVNTAHCTLHTVQCTVYNFGQTVHFLFEL